MIKSVNATMIYSHLEKMKKDYKTKTVIFRYLTIILNTFVCLYYLWAALLIIFREKMASSSLHTIKAPNSIGYK